MILIDNNLKDLAAGREKIRKAELDLPHKYRGPLLAAFARRRRAFEVARDSPVSIHVDRFCFDYLAATVARRVDRGRLGLYAYCQYGRHAATDSRAGGISRARDRCLFAGRVWLFAYRRTGGRRGGRMDWRTADNYSGRSGLVSVRSRALYFLPNIAEGRVGW